MPGTKAELASLFRDYAAMMELRGENPFRCRAYENAARALEGLEGDPADWLTQGTLKGVKGIGAGLTEHIEEWVATGKIAASEKLKKEIPPGLLDMMTIPGLGPKKAKALWDKLGVVDMEKLEAGAKDGSIAALAGFGPKSAENILAGIEQRRKFSGRHRLDVALDAAGEILDQLKKLKVVRRIELGGSVRRRRETIKDLDFVVESDAPETVMEAFVNDPNVERVVGHGETKSSVLLRNGIPADLRVVDRAQFAAALNYFTGSKEHNTHLRGRAKKMGFKLNEYGLFPDDKETALPCKDEADIYKRLGLRYIEPEMREDQGEIEAAEADELPNLLTMDDVRGVLHCHTTYSDGKSTLAEMARAAQAAGYSYLGICDHSQSAAYAGGLKEADVLRQHEEIDKLNPTFKDFVIFKGIESDILAKGELDYPDRFLERFDFVVASVHSRFQLSREEMTRRICNAVSHPATAILGHPSGRLLLERDGYEFDLDDVLTTAAEHKVAIEINADPHRLDLDWRFIRQAKKAGCLFAVNPDAHHTSGYDNIPLGVGIARKGWLEAKDVINTLTANEFRAWLASRKSEKVAHPKKKSRIAKKIE